MSEFTYKGIFAVDEEWNDMRVGLDNTWQLR